MTSRAEAVWRGMRALFEGAEASVELLAEVAGRDAARVAARAAREGWTRAEGGQAAQLRRRLEMQHERLIGELEAFAFSKRVDKAKVDAVMSMIKALEKIGESLRPLEAANNDNEKTTDDAEIADILARLDRQMRAIAAHHARELADGRADAAPGADGGARMGGPCAAGPIPAASD